MRSITLDVSQDSVLCPAIDRRNEVIKWGLTNEDNQLPSIVQHLATESVTAKSCISWVLNAVLGKGFKDGGAIVHKGTGLTLNRLHRAVGREVVTQAQSFLHVGYNADLKPDRIKMLPSTRVRIGKPDDANYSGKFCIADWTAKRISPADIEIVDRYNPHPEVIAAQIEAAGGITKFKGQVLHITKDDSFKYAPSDLFPVLEDAELEKLSKIFRRNGAKYGFLNSKAIIVGQLDNEEERLLKKDFENLQGADNASNMLIYQASQAGIDLDKQMVVKDLSTKLDDKILAYSDEAAEAAICKAFRVPVSLVSSKSEGIFGNSGELLKEMKVQLYEGREYERMLIEEAINDILRRGDFEIQKSEIIDPFNTSV